MPARREGSVWSRISNLVKAPGPPQLVDFQTPGEMVTPMPGFATWRPAGFHRGPGHLFNGPPTVEQVSQGPIADCSLMAAECAVVHNEPETIMARVVAVGREGAIVTLGSEARGDIRHRPVATTYPKVDVGRRDLLGTHAHLIGGAQWPAAIEKAAALDVPGGFDGMSGLSPAGCLEQLTGRPAFRYDVNAMSDEQLKSGVISSIKNKLPTLFWADADLPEGGLGDDLNVIGKHSYWLKDFDEKTGLVQLGNPWGTNKAVTPEPMTIAQLRQLMDNVATTSERTT